LEDGERLEKFKEAALNHAKKFQLSNIMPLYEQYYGEVINQTIKAQ
jgi:hypothetical protein